jgi:hypothetical protein
VTTDLLLFKNRVSPMKIFVLEDGFITETCSAVKEIVETYDIKVV